MKKVFAIYDSKAEGFELPATFLAKGEALREFQDAVNNNQTKYGKHPEDFTLFELGDYDEHKGLLIPSKTITSLGVGIEFVKKAE